MIPVQEPAQTFSTGPCPACGRVTPPDARFCSGCGHPLVEASGQVVPVVADPLIGRVLADRYRIVSLLGRGGMGVVYKVEHVHIGKLMAMKLLAGELSRNREVLKRFRREAEAASKLSHPNTVQIFDFGQAEGLTYLVMEYVEGVSLGQLIKQSGALDMARAARIGAQICASVSEAHELGIVHRDVKPENVMLVQGRSEPDFVKVLDFGLAKLREGSDATVTVTRAGHIVGTPYYMAPEQIRGEEVDGRTDVYSIGALLYRALTGTPPYWAPSPVGVLTKHLTEPLVPPSQRIEGPLPPEADAIVARAMQKHPADRYPNADALRADLLDYLRSVGEDSGAAFLGSSSASSLDAGAGSARPAGGEVATRSDVDAFERRIRRRGWLGYAVLALLISGAAASGLWAWSKRPAQQGRQVETEPNDEPAQANPLPEGMAVEGHLGARMSRERSDADVYRIDTPDGERRVIRVEVTAIPNMDLVVEIAKAGRSTPLIEADSGGEGEPEHIANFPIEGGTHFLRVRERWVAGRLPTENVSDPYRVRWEVVEPGPEDEREINDSLELANPIRPGESRRGFIGWAQDVDTFCLEDPSGEVVAVLEGVDDLDLVLRTVDRGRGTSRKVDRGGVGEGERSEVVTAGEAGSTCFEVSADASEGRRARADAAYRLRVERVGP
ncbi:MAG: serine/threonine-protein kinase [Myxococcota bacterium]